MVSTIALAQLPTDNPVQSLLSSAEGVELSPPPVKVLITHSHFFKNKSDLEITIKDGWLAFTVIASLSLALLIYSFSGTIPF